MRTAPLWLKRAVRDGFARLDLDIRPVRVDDSADYLRLYSRESVEARRFYNVGAGSFRHPCWTNIDLVTDWYRLEQRQVDIEHDLMSGAPLPIEDGRAEIIFTSHTIEHVKDEAVHRLFREAWRALKPGGFLRVTTGPDADLDYAALMRGDADWFSWDARADVGYEETLFEPATTRPLEERWLHHVASILAPNDRCPSAHKFAAPEIRRILAEKGMVGALDFFTSLTEFRYDRPGNHVSWWNAEKIVDALEQAGFGTVYRSAFGQSFCPVLRNTYYFDRTEPVASVYIEAVR